MRDAARIERAVGALVGSVVGDALGAPFEFGPPGRLRAAFPEPVLLGDGEMVGGGPWAPAEWTDDTQMGLLVAQSLLDTGGLDEADLFARFKAWAGGGPKDIGIQTRSVLLSGQPWDVAARSHAESGRPAAGNGSLMRATASALYFAGASRAATIDAARRISALTHGDPAAGEGCAIFHELIRRLLDGADGSQGAGSRAEGSGGARPRGAGDHLHLDGSLGWLLDGVLDLVTDDPARRAQWATRLDPGYQPADDPLPNGAVWPALGAALWALRTTDSFEGAMRAAVDLGGDTDTVACIAGGLAGARYGIGAIPSRWTTHLHGQLIGRTDSGLGIEQLQSLAGDLLQGRPHVVGPLPDEHVVEPTLVFEADQVYAASFPGVVAAQEGGRLAEEAQVISLSRTFGQLDAHRARNQVWLIDQDRPGTNASIIAVLDDVIATMGAARAAGRPIVVHCHGGRSRTGLILRAWAMSRDPSLSVDQATAQVRARWAHLDTWNSSFDRALRAWSTARR